jgi:hypothetical protein
MNDQHERISMDIFEATRRYESWMARYVKLVSRQLIDKHARMREQPFTFFRGTHYRWVQLWHLVVEEGIQKAPSVLAVGDLHVDSFGTWRDVEGRLIWGVDDFDEAFPMPYTNDLVRLAASVKIAATAGALEISLRDACDAILKGYRETLRQGGAAIALAEEEHFLQTLGIAELKPPEDFWDKLNRLPTSRRDCPRAARKALEQTLPKPVSYKLVSRTSGTGSLGQPRFVAIAEWKGGFIAREAKATVPSASAWDRKNSAGKNYYNEIIESAVRAHDPFQRVVDGWLIRRLSPDSNPIAITDWPKKRDEFNLLLSMGREAANVHVGSGRGQIKKVAKHLEGAETSWLYEASKQMAKAITKDWKVYRGKP